MKFTIMSGDLADAVTWVSHALPRRTPTPVLAGILLKAGDDGVDLAAFDYDTSRKISVELDAPVDPGRVLVPGKLLADVAKTFPKNELVDVAADDQEVVLRCGRSEYALTLLPVDDYPSLPGTPPAVGTAPAKPFADAVADAAVAAGTDGNLPMLTGVRFEVGDGLVDLAATDRYRATWRTLEWTSTIDAPEHLTALIPAKILQDVARSLPSGSSVDVGVSPDKGLMSFTIPGRCTTVRLLDDQFVDFRAHFNKQKDPDRVAEFDAAALGKVVKRVSLMAERSTAIRLTFDQDGVLVQAGGGDVGRGSEQCDATLDGDEITIAFSPSYLAAALASFGAGPVQLRMTTPTKPVILVRPDNTTYRHLLMPIKLS